MRDNKIDRRTFLQRSASTASAFVIPTIITKSVLGQNAPSNNVNLAMIGVGGRGSGVMKWFAGKDDVRFLAVCDPNKTHRDRAISVLDEKYGSNITKGYNDFREMLERDDIDGVVICTQDHWHVPAAIYAARVGKDMYVEKPLSTSMSWSWQLREDIKRYGSVFQYGTQQRSYDDFRFACELVRNGYVGEIHRIEAWCPDISEQIEAFNVKQYGSTVPVPVPEGLDYDLWLGPAIYAPYTIDRCTRFGTFHCYDYALGFIAGWGAHPLDIAQWGLGLDHTSPVYYEGSGEIPTQGLYDTVSKWDIHCRYANGITMQFMSERVAKPIVMRYRDKWVSHGTTFFGTKGWVSVDRSGLYTSNPKLKRVKLGPDEIHLYKSNDHVRNFIDCVKSRAKTISPIETAIRSDTISHMSDICIRLNTPIKWDPKNEKIIENKQASVMLNRPMRSPWTI